MLKPAILALSLYLLAAPSWGQAIDAAAAPPAASEPPAAEATQAEQILVVGQRPGPGLWKLSKDGRVLWILGTYAPLPKQMAWRSQQVETVLAQSQEYLAPPAAKVEVGFFRSLTLLPQIGGMKRNPDGARLRDVLPPEAYARWLPLKQKYIGDDDSIERERPVFAAEELFRRGLSESGLTDSNEVRKQVEQLVKRHKLKFTRTAISVPLADPSGALKAFKKSPLEDAACFTRTIDRLESDLDAMRVRANAWARGNIDAIRKLDFADRDAACTDAMLSSPALRNEPAFRTMKARMRENWLAAAEKALATNASSFALLPMKEVLDPNGLLAVLAAKGYALEQPD